MTTVDETIASVPSQMKEGPRITVHRHRSPYRGGVQLARALWWLCQHTLFRFSPQPAYRWRRYLLSLFGADLDPTARIHPTVRLEQPWNLTIGANSAVGDSAILYALGRIRIGARVTISQGSHLCAGTHDYRSADMPLVLRPITIEDDAWITADAFVGPGVTVGTGAILSARGVAMEDLAPWTIYVGNPAVAVKPRPPLTPCFGGSDTSTNELVDRSYLSTGRNP